MAIERGIVAAISASLGVSEREVRESSFLLSGSRAFSSFALLELILRLEDAFRIDVPDEDLDRDRFDSLGSIADYVERRLVEGT